MAFALRVEPGEHTAAPGTAAVFTVLVANQGDIVDRVVLDVLGPAAAWAVVEPAELSLFPGMDGAATIRITSPQGTAPGPVAFGVRATGTASGLAEIGEATLEVAPSYTIEAQLRPRTATGHRRASSVVVLHNAGNAPTTVELAASDPDDAIIFDAPARVEVASGATAELPLRMRLPPRPKHGSTLPYTVVVSGPATGQSLDGQVRQPPRRRWPVVAALLVLGLAAAAFLALRPEDSVAVLGGGSDGAATITTALSGATGESTTTGGPGAPVTTAGGTAGPPSSAVDPTTIARRLPDGPTSTSTSGTIPRPTTSSTSPKPLPCPAKGDAVTTARRVACAWEVGRLGEVSDSIGPATAAALAQVPRVGAGATGQTVKDSVTADGFTTVFFDRCGTARGVSSLRLPVSGADAGRVTGFQRCP